MAGQDTHLGLGVVQIGGNVINSTVVVINNIALHLGATHNTGSNAPVVSEVLAAMDELEKPERINVLNFLDREFGTRMVRDLHGRQLFRALRYVEAILNRKRSDGR